MSAYVPRDHQFDPQPADTTYAQIFADLAAAVESCPHSERVAVLLSTCRNHWMATNAVFVDVRLVVGQTTLPDPVSRALFELERDRPEAALSLANDAARPLAQAREKLAIWDDRVELFSEFESEVESAEGFSQDRLRQLLDAQMALGPSDGKAATARFLALSLSDEPQCVSSLDLLRRAVEEVGEIIALARLTAEALLAQRPVQQELDLVGSGDGDERSRPALAAALKQRADRTKELRLVDDNTLKLTRPDGTTLDVALDDEASALDKTVLCNVVIPALRRDLIALQQELARGFSPNIGQRPMPGLFVIDLVSKPFAGAQRARDFRVEDWVSNADPAPNKTKVALLRCSVPYEAFYRGGERYFYDRDRDGGQLVEDVTALMERAIELAAENGASFLIAPEVLLPRTSLTRVSDLAEDKDIALVTGVEYGHEASGDIINEVMLKIPGLREAALQRKQRPSVYEVDALRFSSDGVLHRVTKTALGTLGVIVCSDYLYLDVLWHLASREPRLDTLIVCASNPQPRVFERLAVADALRLFANVIVVNTVPMNEGADPGSALDDGTVIAVPSRDEPFVGLIDVEIDFELPGAPAPVLSLAEIDMSKIWSRDAERSARGYVSAPAFVKARKRET